VGFGIAPRIPVVLLNDAYPELEATMTSAPPNQQDDRRGGIVMAILLALVLVVGGIFVLVFEASYGT
jgi:hypothetical protein